MTSEDPTSGEWERVSQTPAFHELTRRRRQFVLPAVLFFTIYFLAWPILGGFTTVLDGPAIGAMPWAYVYGFSQFVVILVILQLYRRQAAGWDRLAALARTEAREGTTA